MQSGWVFFSEASVAGFAIAVVLAFIGRWLFVSDKKREADLGTKILGSVGGSRNARVASEEFERRKSGLR